MKVLLSLALFVVCFPTAAASAKSPSPRICFGQQHAVADEATNLSRRVVQLYNQGKIDEAIPLAERVLVLRQQALKDNDPLVADAISNLGALHQANKNYDKAEDLYKRSLAIFEVSSNAAMNSVLDSLSLLHYAKGDLSKAESHARRALELKEKMLGADHIEVTTTLTILINIYGALGDHKKAKPLYLRVVSILEKTDRIVPETVARALASYACSVTSDKVETQKRIDDLFVKVRPGVPARGVVSGGLMNGKAACLPAPTYPMLARENRVRGTVVVQVTIDEAGKVISAKAVKGPSELASVSESAALKARFMPTYLSGYPVRVTGIITYNFVVR